MRKEFEEIIKMSNLEAPSTENKPKVIKISKKIIVLGEGGIGKTTILVRYVKGQFSDSTKMTIGSDFFIKKLKFNSDDPEKGKIENRLKLLLWDFAGEERFRFLLSDYTRGADAIIMGFDLSRPITLFHLDNWMNVLKEGETYKNNVPIYLIGTKKDIIDEENNLVDYGYIEEWVKNHNIIEFIETSSKTGENVNKLFLTIAKHIVEYNEKIN